MQHDANLHATKIRLRPWMHQNSYRLDNELASGQNHNFQKIYTNQMQFKQDHNEFFTSKQTTAKLHKAPLHGGL
jgi:hypothetical protein